MNKNIIDPYGACEAEEDTMILNPYAYAESKSGLLAEEQDFEQPSLSLPALDGVLADAEQEAEMLCGLYRLDETDDSEQMSLEARRLLEILIL